MCVVAAPDARIQPSLDGSGPGGSGRDVVRKHNSRTQRLLAVDHVSGV